MISSLSWVSNITVEFSGSLEYSFLAPPMILGATLYTFFSGAGGSPPEAACSPNLSLERNSPPPARSIYCTGLNNRLRYNVGV